MRPVHKEARVGALLVLLAFGACERPSVDGGQESKAPSTEQGGTIVVGAALPLSGSEASWGQKAQEAIQMAVQQYDSARAGTGPRVQVRFEDTRGDAEGGAAAVRALLTGGRPIAIIGDITSGATAAMIPLADQDSVVLVSPSASADALSGKSRFFFRLWPTDGFETTAFAGYLTSTGTTRVAVLQVQNAYGEGVWDVFQTAYPASGGTIALHQAYSPDETNFRPVLRRIAAAGVNAIYIIGYYQDASAIVTQAQDLGLNLNFFGTTTVGDPEIVRLAGNAATGLVFSELLSFNAENPASPLAASFVTNFRSRFGRDPGWAEAHSFDAMQVVLSAIRSGARTPEQVREYLDQAAVDGVTGRIEFDEKGDIQGRHIAIRRIVQGQTELVRTITPESATAPR